MSFTKFMKQNQIQKANTTYKATKSLVDDKGEALEWILQPVSTKVNDKIRDMATTEVRVNGNKNMFRPKFDSSLYIAKLICASVVEPDLNNKELQDSYGVMSAEDLIKEMIPSPNEYDEFAKFIQEYNGYDLEGDDKVAEAKN